jgi:hypothetical protein
MKKTTLDSGKIHRCSRGSAMRLAIAGMPQFFTEQSKITNSKHSSGFMYMKSLSIGLIGSFVLALSAWAGTPTLEGIVKDASGRPIKGADVRIEGKNGNQVVKTDATGHYISNGLAAGVYKVSLVVNGVIKASILSAKTQSSKPTELNFDLTAKTAPVKKHTHMVWVAGETGTHIGTGRWVEVDDNGNPVNDAGVNSVEKLSGSAIKPSRQGHAVSPSQ